MGRIVADCLPVGVEIGLDQPALERQGGESYDKRCMAPGTLSEVMQCMSCGQHDERHDIHSGAFALAAYQVEQVQHEQGESEDDIDGLRVFVRVTHSPIE